MNTDGHRWGRRKLDVCQERGRIQAKKAPPLPDLRLHGMEARESDGQQCLDAPRPGHVSNIMIFDGFQSIPMVSNQNKKILKRLHTGASRTGATALAVTKTGTPHPGVDSLAPARPALAGFRLCRTPFAFAQAAQALPSEGRRDGRGHRRKMWGCI